MFFWGEKNDSGLFYIVLEGRPVHKKRGNCKKSPKILERGLPRRVLTVILQVILLIALQEICVKHLLYAKHHAGDKKLKRISPSWDSEFGGCSAEPHTDSDARCPPTRHESALWLRLFPLLLPAHSHMLWAMPATQWSFAQPLRLLSTSYVKHSILLS